MWKCRVELYSEIHADISTVNWRVPLELCKHGSAGEGYYTSVQTARLCPTPSIASFVKGLRSQQHKILGFVCINPYQLPPRVGAASR